MIHDVYDGMGGVGVWSILPFSLLCWISLDTPVAIEPAFDDLSKQSR